MKEHSVMEKELRKEKRIGRNQMKQENLLRKRENLEMQNVKSV
jgi:hypothetical protein